MPVATRRRLGVAVAQMGPVHAADRREAVVERLVAMLATAQARGAALVVFPELALTTFFPRHWMDEREAEARYFETAMPNPVVRPLFDAARRLGVGFHLGYAELTPEGRRYNTAILVDRGGAIVGKYRKIHLPGHADHKPDAPFQHLEKKYFEVGDLGFRVFGADGTRVGLCICNDRRWPETFRVMANSVVGIMRDTCTAYSRSDATLAKVVLQSEDCIEAFKVAILKDAESRIAQGSMHVDFAFTLHEIANECCSMADHCTNIAEQIIYSLTGAIVRHMEGRWVEVPRSA